MAYHHCTVLQYIWIGVTLELTFKGSDDIHNTGFLILLHEPHLRLRATGSEGLVSSALKKIKDHKPLLSFIIIIIFI